MRQLVLDLVHGITSPVQAERDRSADEVTDVLRSLSLSEVALLMHSLVAARVVESHRACQESQLDALAQLNERYPLPPELRDRLRQLDPPEDPSQVEHLHVLLGSDIRFRRYINPALTPDEALAVEDRNWCLVAINQALLGGVSPNCLAVAFEWLGSRLVVHVVLAESVAEDVAFFREDLGTEIEAPWPGESWLRGIDQIETIVHVSPVPPEVLSRMSNRLDGSRMVFAQRGWRDRAS